jgi:hypothetical protein
MAEILLPASLGDSFKKGLARTSPWINRRKIGCQGRLNAASLRNRWPRGNGVVPGGPHPAPRGGPEAAGAGSGFTPRKTPFRRLAPYR